MESKPSPGPAPLRQNGKAHPLKPQSPEQIEAYARMWWDPAVTVEAQAEHYHVNPRTLSVVWRVEFKLPKKTDVIAQAKERQARLDAEAAPVMDGIDRQVSGLAGEMSRQVARLGAAIDAPRTGDVLDPKWNPLLDPEIGAALAEIKADARRVTAHSGLTGLQRKLMRLSILIGSKAPITSWAGLAVVVESLNRSVLQARRIEADIPKEEADQAVLRREAAAQMMRELKSVMNPEEQDQLARLVKLGADRLMERGAQGSIPAEVSA